jgi:pimeloyl-ACP methyl ester carboxylesterase
MIDFSAPDFVVNPYPALSELRKSETPIWHEGLGIWLAAKHRDANAVLRTKTLGRIFTPRDPESEWHEFNWLHSDSILDSEPLKHTRLRSLVGKAFSRSRIESLKPEIERLAGLLLDQAETKLNNTGSFDLIADYAEPLPVKVIAALLGFPDEDEHLLRPWSQAIVKMYEVNPSEEAQAEARTAAQRWFQYESRIVGITSADSSTTTPTTSSTFSALPAALASDEVLASYTIQAHFLAQHCFTSERAVFRQAKKLTHCPVTLVHGKLDMICPPYNAFRLSRFIPNAKIHWVSQGGHIGADPHISQALHAAVRVLEK